MTEHPRLLLLAPSDGFGGGIERVAREIERCWLGRCNRVDLYRRSHRRTAGGGAPVKVAFTVRALRATLGARPDIVVCLHIGMLPVAVAAAAAVRARLALVAIGAETWRTLSALEVAGLRRAWRVLAISSFTADVLAQRSERPRELIHVVALPVEPILLSAAREADLPPQERHPVFLTVSRLWAAHRYKGHFQVAESLPRVLDCRADARWVIVGGGDDVVALRTRCDQLGILPAVSFEGSVPDERLVQLYRAATAMVLPSVTDLNARPPHGEGFGLVYAEAAAFGVPSIASTALGGAADVVAHERTGLTVRPGHPGDLAHAMIRLAEDRPLRDRLGRAARDHVLARHTQDNFRQSLEAALTGARSAERRSP